MGTNAILPRITLVRHGETEWAKAGKHTGRTDVPLTTTGEDAARKLPARLAGTTFSHVFTSPLSRAWRTCELAGFTGTVEPDVIEWNYGEYEGLTTAQIRDKRPDWDLFRDGCPGGESAAGIAVRVDRLVTKLKSLSGEVLLFAHGHILRVLASRWIGQPVGFAQHLLLGTAAISVLGFDHNHPDEPAIAKWNA